MRAVVQRVSEARCTVDGQVTGAIEAGLVVLLGVAHQDTPRMAEQLAHKVAHLRIFADEQGKMNLNVGQSGGAVLSISQFTLLADTRSGHRPSFTGAAAPEQASALYQVFNQALRAAQLRVEEGVFGAHMRISLVNDGPVTIQLEVGG